MTRLITFFAIFLMSAFALVGVSPVHADEDNMSRKGLYNLVVDPGLKIAFTLTNVGGPANGAACDLVKGDIGIWSTTTSMNGDGDGSSTHPLALLDKVPFELTPGKTLPVEVMQPFEGPETLLIWVDARASAHLCLAPSSATVRNLSGEMQGIAGRNEVPIGVIDTASDAPWAPCCACAPVCGCGFCP